MMDRHPLARYAALSGFAELCAELGLDSSALLHRSGFDVASLDTPDRWVRAADVAALLERAAVAARREDFGLRMAELRRFANLGPLGMVIREEPDLRSALTTLIRHNHMYNEAVRTRLAEHDGTATVNIELRLGTIQPARQAAELAVGTLFRAMKELCGPSWEPRAVRFAHARPKDMTVYHRVFGPRIAFGQRSHGVVIRAADLDAPNVLADPLMLPYAQRLLADSTGATSATVVDRTRELIETLLPAGRCSIEQVSRSFGMSRRTTHRKLKQAGATFTELLDDTRADLARRLVVNRDNSLSDVAELLGFSSASNFSRWFRDRFGLSPREWRHSPQDAEGVRPEHGL